MFTGIIEECGTIVKIEKTHRCGKLFVQTQSILADTRIGDSIAVNGVCLTVTTIDGSVFSADVMAETFRRSNLGGLKAGSSVNLERALRADGRFGGHIVSGHIDGTGTITAVKNEENAVWIFVQADNEIMNLIVEKGSIAIDGISLTVADKGSTFFAVSVIPHTGEQTTLLHKKKGDRVNLENDVIGKYVKALLCGSTAQKNTGSCSSTAETDKKLLDWLNGCTL